MANSLIAAVLTFLIPGLGQLYAGRLLRAVGMFLLTGAVVALLAATIVLAPLVVLVYIAVAIDAYRIA